MHGSRGGSAHVGDNDRWSVTAVGHLSDAKDLNIHVPWTSIKASFQYCTTCVIQRKKQIHHE